MQEEKPVRRGVYILPNLFTTASLFTGFLAMLLAVQGNIEGSALAILFSALMDGLDGKVARLTNTASEFGIQYDSLADLVAFGVAPAFTSWMWVLEGYGKLGIGVAFLYVACTALRLARFNVCVTTVSKKFFVGLPCPAAGCAVAMFILFSSYLPSWLEARTPFLGLVVTFVMALLMVSRVRYFSFKEYGFLKTHAFSSMISAVRRIVSSRVSIPSPDLAETGTNSVLPPQSTGISSYSVISCFTLSILAPGLSILLTATMISIPAALAWLIASTV